MAISNYTKVRCDLCDKTIDVSIRKDYRDKVIWTERESGQQIKPWARRTMTVVFTTEQNEGTPCEPYFDTETIDICPQCETVMLKIWPIRARGAQGYNNYDVIGGNE